MHPGDCRPARIRLPGPLDDGVTYTVTLSTTGGLTFDRECTDRAETWTLVGRTVQRRDYAVYACEGHTTETLRATLYQSSLNLSGTDASVTLTPRPTPIPLPTPLPTPEPTVEPGPTPEPTPRPTLLPDLTLPNPADGDTFNLKRPDCRDIYPATDLYDTNYGYHGDHRYPARSSIYGGWVPKITLFILSRHMPKLLDLCAIGFAHHVTDYQGDTTLHGTMRWRVFDNPWDSESLQIGCGGGFCEWESEPIEYTSNQELTVNMEATHNIDLYSSDPPTTSTTWDSEQRPDSN